MAESRSENRRFKPGSLWIWATVTFVLAGAMMYFFYVWPRAELGPEQPIAFSHRVHAGVKQIDCRFCHAFVDRSKRAGLPTVRKCFFCHEYIIKLHPEILNERKYLETDTPVPWVQVFYVPDHVKFFHFPHITWGELECAACHGLVERMDRLKRVEFNMGFCITCHRRMNVQLDCWLACHH